MSEPLYGVLTENEIPARTRLNDHLTAVRRFSRRLLRVFDCRFFPLIMDSFKLHIKRLPRLRVLFARVHSVDFQTAASPLECGLK